MKNILSNLQAWAASTWIIGKGSSYTYPDHQLRTKNKNLKDIGRMP